MPLWLPKKALQMGVPRLNSEFDDEPPSADYIVSGTTILTHEFALGGQFWDICFLSAVGLPWAR
jgi:hypothetical protein